MEAKICLICDSHTGENVVGPLGKDGGSMFFRNVFINLQDDQKSREIVPDARPI